VVRLSAHYVFPISRPPLRNAVITLADDGTVTDVSDGCDQPQESEGVRFYNGILAPAFVNAHCHLELSYMQGKIERHTGLAGFVPQIAAQRQAASPEQILSAARFADARLWRSGTAAVADIANSDSCFDVKRTSKIFYHTFIEKFGLLPEQKDKALQQAQRLQRTAYEMNLSASVTPHAPYSVLPELLQALVALAQQQGVMSIHSQESADEQRLFEHGDGALASLFSAMGLTLPPANGQHSLRYLAQYIPRDIRLLLVHNLYTTDEHYDFAAAWWDKIFWVLCPVSNLFIINELPPVEMLRRKGATIALGTDSGASHPSLLLIDDLKTLHRHFPHIPLHELLTWATLGGARALQIDDTLGTIECGKKPGIVWIQGVDLQTLRLTEGATAERIR
jgi:cytosine/adenosine deaminase-related metal-dependent hydrolase